MKKIIFSLPAAALGDATEALLLGDFNNWSLDEAIALKKDKDGDTYKAAVTLETGKTYEYRFLLNDGRWVNDWQAHNYVHKAHFGIDNSVITVTDEENVIKKTVTPKPAKSKAPATTKSAVTGNTKKAAAKKVSAPAKDDLTKVEGIGPAIAALLAQESIVTFKDLAKTTVKKLKDTLIKGGNAFAMHDPKSWPKQAKLAAAGKWDELKALQDELLGGK